MSATGRRREGTLETLRALIAEARAAKRIDDAEGAKRARRLLRTIASPRTDFHGRGVALAAIVDDRLHRPLGYATFRAMLAGEAVMSATQARKLMAIARAVPARAAIDLGQERAHALVAYARRKKSSAARLLARDARIDGVPLSRCSVRDLKRAARPEASTTTTPSDRVRSALAAAGLRARITIEGDLVVARVRIGR